MTAIPTQLASFEQKLALRFYGGWAEIGPRNGIENQSESSGRHTKLLNGIGTTRIEILIFGKHRFAADRIF